MRIGIKKTKTPEPALTVNKAGGVVYEIKDPVNRLIFTIGHMANEPKFYDDDTSYVDPTGAGLNSEALGIIKTTQEVLDGKTPEDAFVIARWARDKVNGLKMRTTPLLSFIAAAEDARPGTIQVQTGKTRRWGKLLKAYAPHIMTRADEPRLAFASWSVMFGNDGTTKGRRNRNIPTALKASIGKVLRNTSEQLLAKWAGSGSPSLSDVVRTCCPELIALPKILYFVNQEAWLAGGAFTTPNGKKYPKRFDPAVATPVLYARYLLGQKKTWDDETKCLLAQAHVEWEFALSMFGEDPACKKEIWGQQMKSMGYMALIKNLRNLLENGADINTVLERVSNPEEVKKGGLLPFRYLSAARIFGIDKLAGRDRGYGNVDEHETRAANVTAPVKAKVIKALSKALDHSIENLPEMPGTTVLMVDISGSMENLVSNKSKMSMKEAAAILAACFAKRSDHAVIIVFATDAAELSYIATDSALTITEKMLAMNGGSTYAHLAIDLLIRKGIKADRIIMLSDMQCYSDSYGATQAPVQTSLNRYRNAFNKDVWFHSINLAGTPESPTAPKGRVSLYSGFSEQILTLIAKVEAGEAVKLAAQAEDEDKLKITIKELPTIEALRAQYSLNIL